MKKLSLFLTICFLVACSLKQKPEAVPTPKEEGTLFISLSITQKEKMEWPNVSLLLEKRTATKMKMASLFKEQEKPGWLGYALLDQQGNPLFENFVSNPLVGHAEFVNEEGALERKKQEKKQAVLPLRMPLSPEAKFFKMNFVTQEGKKIDLFTLSLSEKEMPND